MTQIAQLVGVTVAPQLAISANADWRGSVTLKEGVDLAGVAFRMQLRAPDSQALLADLSTDNGMLTAAGAVLTWALPAAKTKFLAPYAATGAIADILAEAEATVLNLCAAPLAVTITAGVTTP